MNSLIFQRLTLTSACVLALLVFTPMAAYSQDEATDTEPNAVEEATAAEETSESTKEVTDDIKKKAGELADQAKTKVDEIASEVDKSEKAKEYSAGILKPIYQLAETLEFSAFHWVAFTLMVAGVVSYALQLVLGKLIVLAHSGFSSTEILADAVGLVISLFGLVLTTQAATQNSQFTQSAFAVLSATAVGAVFGFVLYLWGQSQEVQAAKGRAEQIEEIKKS